MFECNSFQSLRMVTEKALLPRREERKSEGQVDERKMNEGVVAVPEC